MTINAAVGQAQVMDAREAGMQAAHQALNALTQRPGAFSGSTRPSLCLVIVPHRYDPQLVISGVASMLSYQPGVSSETIPIIGMSVSSGLTENGVHAHSVIVAILDGDSLETRIGWFANYSQSSGETAVQLGKMPLHAEKPLKQVLIFADGLLSNTNDFCSKLPADLPVSGGLSSGDALNLNSFQIAGMESGSGALAAAFLYGDFSIGSGHAHGWHALGLPVRITATHEFSIKTINDQPAALTYSQLFGQTAAAWCSHPLNTLSRIYPLGFEQSTSPELVLRAPIHMETDGSLRLNSIPTQGSNAYLMVGSPADSQKAARQAAQQALLNLGTAKPVFALVLVDIAWQTLLQAHPGQEIRAIQEIIGNKIPIAGGYTTGQLLPPVDPGATARFANQEILVLLFGETEKQE